MACELCLKGNGIELHWRGELEIVLSSMRTHACREDTDVENGPHTREWMWGIAMETDINVVLMGTVWLGKHIQGCC